MSSLRGLLDALQIFVKDSLKEMQLPVSQEGPGDDPMTRPIEVYKQRLDDPTNAREKIPYILLQILNGEDTRDSNTREPEASVTVRAIIAIYERDPSEGALALINIVEKLRMDLLRTGVIGGAYEILEPFEYLFYPEDTIPYHVAELSTTWRIGTVERVVPALDGYPMKW
ncbi:MAG: hypothetical protein LUE89_11370 [Clostridiales bacterium]|nr:hypothetical protein [Clostridiales bacterium]